LNVLIAEDDTTSREILQRFLSPVGNCDTVANGRDAISAFEQAHEKNSPYRLVCLDIIMPDGDGLEILEHIRSFEETHRIRQELAVKVIMTTSLDDSRSVIGAFKGGCESYLVKPIDKQKLNYELIKLGIIETP